ncbi:unnamed protein product [Tenebrio molitor]|nr:unnamed protein product [Tenebrio molitor]
MSENSHLHTPPRPTLPEVPKHLHRNLCVSAPPTGRHAPPFTTRRFFASDP